VAIIQLAITAMGIDESSPFSIFERHLWENRPFIISLSQIDRHQMCDKSSTNTQSMESCLSPVVCTNAWYLMEEP
jgi:hypothetical protein